MHIGDSVLTFFSNVMSTAIATHANPLFAEHSRALELCESLAASSDDPNEPRGEEQEKNLSELVCILEKYQENGALLDPHLEKVTETLFGGVRTVPLPDQPHQLV